MGAFSKVNAVKTGIKGFARRSAAAVFHLSGAYKAFLKGKVLILMYHRVLPEKDLIRFYTQPGMHVLESVFLMQMNFFQQNFNVLSLDDLLHYWATGGLDNNQRYCVITFDDGWLDNYLYAYPILKEKGIPATIFLPTSFIGTDQWFWPDRLSYLLKNYHSNKLPQEKREAIQGLVRNYLASEPAGTTTCLDEIDPLIELFKRLPAKMIESFIREASSLLEAEVPHDRLLLDWNEVQEMSGDGISFGAHSASHQILTNLSLENACSEIEEPLKVLQAQNISLSPVFCYPNGNYNRDIAECVKACGYKAAVSTHFGHESRFPEDPYSLKRIGMHNDISNSIPLLTFHISGLNRLCGNMMHT
jgi:peptidoglycan/xylan/chitin deacetylase (PgdA/CDA1 family)